MEIDLAQNQINYINSLQRKGDYKFSHYAEASCLSTSFSVMSLFALGAQDVLAKNKKEICDFLTSKVNDAHQVIDESYFKIEITSKKHSADYVINQTTFFSFIALDILGTTFDRLNFVTPFYDLEYLEQWVRKRFEGNFWAESNRLMFLFYFLTYLHRYGASPEKIAAKGAIDRFFELLNELQDTASGYWGKDKSLARKAYGAAHLYLFYDYFDREIPLSEKIIDSTLSLHAGNGLAETREGGACEDYDLVEIYLRVLKQTNYKRDQVLAKLLGMEKTIRANANVNGGFSYRFHVWPFSLQRFFPVKPPMDATYCYSSLKSMTTPVYYPDCWATFFRNLSLNGIEFIADQKKVPTYGLPGWGFLYKN